MEGCSNIDQGLDLVKAFDDFGSLIVLGNVVFLKIEQVGSSFHFNYIIYSYKILRNCCFYSYHFGFT